MMMTRKNNRFIRWKWHTAANLHPIPIVVRCDEPLMFADRSRARCCSAAAAAAAAAGSIKTDRRRRPVVALWWPVLATGNVPTVNCLSVATCWRSISAAAATAFWQNTDAIYISSDKTRSVRMIPPTGTWFTCNHGKQESLSSFSLARKTFPKRRPDTRMWRKAYIKCQTWWQIRNS